MNLENFVYVAKRYLNLRNKFLYNHRELTPLPEFIHELKYIDDEKLEDYYIYMCKATEWLSLVLDLELEDEECDTAIGLIKGDDFTESFKWMRTEFLDKL